MNLLNAFVIAALLMIGGPAFAADKPAPIAPMSVNINTADAQTLAVALDGVGAARAKAIVEYPAEPLSLALRRTKETGKQDKYSNEAVAAARAATPQSLRRLLRGDRIG